MPLLDSIVIFLHFWKYQSVIDDKKKKISNNTPRVFYNFQLVGCRLPYLCFLFEPILQFKLTFFWGVLH